MTGAFRCFGAILLVVSRASGAQEILVPIDAG